MPSLLPISLQTNSFQFHITPFSCFLHFVLYCVILCLLLSIMPSLAVKSQLIVTLWDGCEWKPVEALHTVTIIHCHTVMSLPLGQCRLCFVILTSSVDIALLLNVLTAAPLHCQWQSLLSYACHLHQLMHFHCCHWRLCTECCSVLVLVVIGCLHL